MTLPRHPGPLVYGHRGASAYAGDNTLEAIALAFEQRGFDVRQAQDFDEAVASARKDSPELAVVDLRMPGKNGLQVVMALEAATASMANDSVVTPIPRA